MIRALRRRHAWLAPGSFALALAALALGAASRPPAPPGGAAARAARDGAAGAAGAAGAEGAEGAEGAALAGATRVARDAAAGLAVVPGGAGAGAGRVRLLVVPLRDLAAPDLLAYAASAAEPGAALPPDAVLLGPVAPARATTVDVPVGAAALVVYSLGHHARVATVDVAALTTRAGGGPVAPAAAGEGR